MQNKEIRSNMSTNINEYIQKKKRKRQEKNILVSIILIVILGLILIKTPYFNIKRLMLIIIML